MLGQKLLLFLFALKALRQTCGQQQRLDHTRNHQPAERDRKLKDLIIDIQPNNQFGDLGYRYSKVVLPDDTDANDLLPLDSANYPINSTTLEWLRRSQCHSVVIPENCLDCDDFEKLIDRIGFYPSHPSQYSSSPYWKEFLEVATVQVKRLANENPHNLMPLPELWKNMNITEVAEAVHDEYPGFHQANLIASLLQGGATIDEDIIPMRSKVEFLRGPVLLAAVNTWAIARVGPPNFLLKWSVGRARPEEIAYKISAGLLTGDDGVPLKVLDAIPLGSLESPESFTAYPEGCPMHPSWPAMHSAASSASMWLPVVLNLTPEQLCQARLTDYAVAYARTVAGVHYPSDNMAGLSLGQDLIADALPEHLAQKYGSDADAVREKIASLRFDWGDFLSSDCVMHRTYHLGTLGDF